MKLLIKCIKCTTIQHGYRTIKSLTHRHAGPFSPQRLFTTYFTVQKHKLSFFHMTACEWVNGPIGAAIGAMLASDWSSPLRVTAPLS